LINVPLVWSLLLGVSGHDAVTLAGASGLFAMAATLSCVLLARRAAHVDVIEVLRSE